MREVEVHVWCDICGRGTPADAERTISIDASKPLRLDLCAGCDKQYVGSLISVLEVCGVEPEPKPTRRRDRRAAGSGERGTLATTPGALSEIYRTCGQCGKVSTTRAALGQHLATQHDTRIQAEIEAGRLPAVTTGRPPGEESV